MKVKLTRDAGSKKAGETIECSPKWAQYALSAGLAILPDKKKKSKPAEEPAPEKSETDKEE